MPKQKTDDLIQLIKSLTRAEKRHFRLFVRRNQASENILFLQLFDILDKYKEYDESVILKRLPAIKKTQLSNLKAHLYKQLLTSLRLVNKKHNEDIQIREMIDYASVLYTKGLYRQSLDVLEKAKIRAEKGKFRAAQLEIIEFEKLLESQYVTNSMEGRAEQLIDESQRLNQVISHNNTISNLSLKLYGLYLKVGYVRNRRDFEVVKGFFQTNLPKVDFPQLDFWGKIYYCQSFVWYYHMTQDFPMSYRYAQKWVDLFDENPEMKAHNAATYLKGLHLLLSALFYTLQHERFLSTLKELHQFYTAVDLHQDRNIEGLFHLFRFIHGIQQHYLEGTFSEGLELVPELVQLIDTDEYNWDDHRILVFYYRIACLYFGSGDNDNAIHYLNLIINQKNPNYREDIQCFARILSLIAHFELGNSQLVEYQVKSVYRFLAKMHDLHAVQQAIFRFLRKSFKMRQAEIKNEFIELRDKLVSLQDDPYERRPFLYLDIISWLESKIENREVQAVIRQKFLKRKAQQNKK